MGPKILIASHRQRFFARLQHLVERNLFPFSTDHGMNVGAVGAIPKPPNGSADFIGMAIDLVAI